MYILRLVRRSFRQVIAIFCYLLWVCLCLAAGKYIKIERTKTKKSTLFSYFWLTHVLCRWKEDGIFNFFLSKKTRFRKNHSRCHCNNTYLDTVYQMCTIPTQKMVLNKRIHLTILFKILTFYRSTLTTNGLNIRKKKTMKIEKRFTVWAPEWSKIDK